ncbi:MAG: DUF4395 domain-containing protein [Bacilli bacterium]
MNFDISCPISGEQRDNTTARVVGGIVCILTVLAFIATAFGSIQLAGMITGFLGIDFLIRAFFHPKYSPLATVARIVVSKLKLQTKMVDSGAKVFAARVGLIFSSAIAVLLICNFKLAAMVVLGVLFLCSLMESAISFCVGCWVYSLLPKKLAIIMSKKLI